MTQFHPLQENIMNLIHNETKIFGINQCDHISKQLEFPHKIIKHTAIHYWTHLVSQEFEIPFIIMKYIVLKKSKLHFKKLT